MTLMERLYEDMKSAMRARDEVRLSVLRMVISAAKNFKIEKYGVSGQELTDEDVLNVLTKQMKQRKDAIESFTSAGRTDLSDKEHAEAKVINEYMPEQMSEEEVRKVVEKAKADLGVSSPAQMGTLMGAIMKELKGKADGSVVQKIVRDVLK